MPSLFASSLALLAASAAAAAAPAAGTNSTGYVNAVYFTNWGIYDTNYQPTDLVAPQISHLNYAFLNLTINGTVYSADPYADTQKRYPGDSEDESDTANVYGCIKQLFLLKKANRHMKTLISIGGWTWSQNPAFATVAASNATRLTFARSAVAHVKHWGLDGIDLDWEYPQDAKQAADMVLLVQAIRDELDAYAARSAPGYRFQLTIASPAGAAAYNKLQLAKLGAILDYIHLMAYDFAGPWSSASGHLANLYTNPQYVNRSADSAVRDYIRAGVPPHKLVLGMPVYGRAFPNTAGLGKPFNATKPTEDNAEPDYYGYKKLPKAGAVEMYDPVAKAAYSYDNRTRELVSYDTPAVTREKVAYVKRMGLGGSMFWEASGDRTGDESLIGTSVRALGSLDSTKNLLHYPDSRYANIRNKMGCS
ncbi:chitinase [Metarhizium guizhouense ARSEF 977]|uniref:Endochitinase 1 n=1 Tax=Metarhizium guizhouense (strain ARSEF 977) TaxID=1276136 RepID=A0A0B4HYG0_METGA|nr:chitinase [Metarhizium guizhouense ARSEF 977]